MAQQDSYVTGVGVYPTAPDTSYGGYFQAHPEHNTAYWNKVIRIEDPGPLYSKDWSWIRNDYDRWVMQLTNQYNADVKNWETQYNTPLNYRELQEAAGYNSQWMQNLAATRAPEALPAGQPFQSPGGYSPQEQLISGFQNILATAAAVMDMKEKQAGIDLKEAQANSLRETTPFKMVKPYWDMVEKMKEHGIAPSGENVQYFGFTPNNGITVSGLPEDSFFNQFQDAQLAKYQFTNAYLKASVDDRKWMYEHLRPLEEKIAQLQEKLLNGQLDMQQFDVEIREKLQPQLIREATSRSIAGMIKPWFDMIASGAKLILDFKSFGLNKLGFGLDWLKETGEVLPGMPGN